MKGLCAYLDASILTKRYFKEENSDTAYSYFHPVQREDGVIGPHEVGFPVRNFPQPVCKWIEEFTVVWIFSFTAREKRSLARRYEPDRFSFCCPHTVAVNNPYLRPESCRTDTLLKPAFLRISSNSPIENLYEFSVW